MHKLVFSILTFLLVISCSTSKYSITTKETKENRFQVVIDSIYKANPEAKGLMVHIEAPDKKISWSGAVGYADYKTKTILEKDQPALIASSIKTYVAAAILRLVEQGHISIDNSIDGLVSSKSKGLLIADGYDVKNIKIKHLLSHTSGIEDYISKNNVGQYFDFITQNKKYRWTRDEQIKITIERGDPLGKAGEIFNYADANFLLATEIIETITKKPFYTAMRELLKYDELGIKNTWFYTLEDTPINTKNLAHQYFGKHQWDSYDIDPSFDLYGGGGIACTSKDLALFSYHFFNNNIVKDTTVKNLIFTDMTTKKGNNKQYFLGLSLSEINGLKAYGHGGFWATVVQYIPKLNTSIAVYVLERDKRILRKDLLEVLVKELQQ